MPHPIDVHVGAAVANYRRIIGLSQTGLAEKLGISFQQVQKYEKGTNRISASKLHTISSVLGVRVQDFFPQPIAQVGDDDLGEGQIKTRRVMKSAVALDAIKDDDLRESLMSAIQSAAKI